MAQVLQFPDKQLNRDDVELMTLDYLSRIQRQFAILPRLNPGEIRHVVAVIVDLWGRWDPPERKDIELPEWAALPEIAAFLDQIMRDLHSAYGWTLARAVAERIEHEVRMLRPEVNFRRPVS